MKVFAEFLVFLKKFIWLQQKIRLPTFANLNSGNQSHANRPATLLKKRLWHRCFPVNFSNFLRTHFLHNTSRRLLLAILMKLLTWVTAWSVQIRSYFWSVFSYIQSEYRKIPTRNNSVFGHFSRSESFSNSNIYKNIHHSISWRQLAFRNLWKCHYNTFANM